MEVKNWIDIKRPYELGSGRSDTSYSKVMKLDESFSDIHTPSGFKINLLSHQMKTIKAMYDLENKRVIEINPHDGVFVPFNTNSMIIETSAGVLSDSLGSGKTYCILGLIKHQNLKDEKNRKEGIKTNRISCISNIALPKNDKVVKTTQYKRREEFMFVGWKTEVRRRYRNFINTTLIFVGKSVLIQWEQAIKENTDLSVYIIENVFHLRSFYEMMNSEKIPHYDIILIKNGNVSGEFTPEELKKTYLGDIKVKPILSVFGELFKGVMFNRVILDDFDTLNIPNTAYVIPAMFTWFVSATKRVNNFGNKKYLANSMEEIMAYDRPSYISVWKNRTLFTFFNISCEEHFIEQSTKASKVDFYVYKFINPNEQFIGALNAMGTLDAHEVMEALNGDAVNAAAGVARCKSTSVADIFQKVLDNKWEIYKKCSQIANYIDTVEDIMGKLDKREKQYSSKRLTEISKNIKAPGPLSGFKSMVNGINSGLVETVEDIKTTNTETKDINGKAIERVKDNLKQGDCPITGEPLRDGPIVIMKCCGITISTEAASYSLKLNQGKNGPAGTCPACRREISFSQLIIVDKDLNLDDIVQEADLIEETVEDVTEVEYDTTLDEDVDIDGEQTAEEELNKYNCIIKIIKGLDNDEDVKAVMTNRNVNIPAMLIGETDKGVAPPENRKVLIYASYPETIEHITSRLIKEGISYLKINGTARMISEMVDRYNLPNSDPNSVAVLLISGVQYCAGLNLQVTTDLIFPHKLIDPNVESQVGGRAARFGRVYNLRVHYVMYENEIYYSFGST